MLKTATGHLQELLVTGDRESEVFERELDAYVEAFDNFWKHYGATDPVIDIQRIRSQLQRSPADGDDIAKTLAMANVTELLRAVLMDDQHISWLDKLRVIDSDLLYPDNIFPDKYVHIQHLGFDSLTFFTALGIRTQRLIAEMETLQQGDFDPQMLLAKTFCDEEAVDTDPKQVVISGPYKAIAGVTLNSDGTGLVVSQDQYVELRELYRQRIKELRGLLSGKDVHSSIAQLKETYPIEGFHSSLKDWVTKFYAAGRAPIQSQLQSQDPNSQGLQIDPALRFLQPSEHFEDAREEQSQSADDAASQIYQRFASDSQ